MSSGDSLLAVSPFQQFHSSGDSSFIQNVLPDMSHRGDEAKSESQMSWEEEEFGRRKAQFMETTRLLLRKKGDLQAYRPDSSQPQQPLGNVGAKWGDSPTNTLAQLEEGLRQLDRCQTTNTSSLSEKSPQNKQSSPNKKPSPQTATTEPPSQVSPLPTNTGYSGSPAVVAAAVACGGRPASATLSNLMARKLRLANANGNNTASSLTASSSSGSGSNSGGSVMLADRISFLDSSTTAAATAVMATGATGDNDSMWERSLHSDISESRMLLPPGSGMLLPLPTSSSSETGSSNGAHSISITLFDSTDKSCPSKDDRENSQPEGTTKKYISKNYNWSEGLRIDELEVEIHKLRQEMKFKDEKIIRLEGQIEVGSGSNKYTNNEDTNDNNDWIGSSNLAHNQHPHLKLPPAFANGMGNSHLANGQRPIHSTTSEATNVSSIKDYNPTSAIVLKNKIKDLEGQVQDLQEANEVASRFITSFKDKVGSCDSGPDTNRLVSELITKNKMLREEVEKLRTSLPPPTAAVVSSSTSAVESAELAAVLPSSRLLRQELDSLRMDLSSLKQQNQTIVLENRCLKQHLRQKQLDSSFIDNGPEPRVNVEPITPVASVRPVEHGDGRIGLVDHSNSLLSMYTEKTVTSTPVATSRPVTTVNTVSTDASMGTQRRPYSLTRTTSADNSYQKQQQTLARPKPIRGVEVQAGSKQDSSPYHQQRHQKLQQHLISRMNNANCVHSEGEDSFLQPLVGITQMDPEYSCVSATNQRAGGGCIHQSGCSSRCTSRNSSSNHDSNSSDESTDNILRDIEQDIKQQPFPASDHPNISKASIVNSHNLPPRPAAGLCNRPNLTIDHSTTDIYIPDHPEFSKLHHIENSPQIPDPGHFSTLHRTAVAPKSGADVRAGDVVKFIRQGGRISKGLVHFIGHLPRRNDVYIGVELELEDGKHDGVYEGHRYFHCKKNKGVFVAFNKVIMVYSRNS